MAEVERNAENIRRECRESFYAFVKHAWPIIEPGTPLSENWHLEAMCRHLQAITFGEMVPWLIINVPPGSSKSTIVSVLWQAWEWGPLGRHHYRYVSTSFEIGNVKRDTRKTRDLIASEWFQKLWPEVELVRTGELSFANSGTGSREGVAFAAITGKRGDRVMIDDPHSLEGAESETERTKSVRTFMEGGLNRTNDAMNSAMIIVMQRLHEGDLTGEILARDLGFVHLMIPMEFETARRSVTPIGWKDPRSYEGELMDPRRYPRAAVERQKKGGEYMWAGQYQQRPAPREGGMFKVEKITIVDAAPSGGEIVSGWDLAGSKRKKSPYSVRVRMKRVGGDYYITHSKRARTTPGELERMIETTIVEDGAHVLQSLPQDPGQAGLAQKHRFAEILAGYTFKITPETGSKEARADPFAAQVEAGRVYMVKGDWNSEFIEELRGFPTSTYKDQVDAASRAFGELVGKRGVYDDAGPELVTAETNTEAPLLDPW